MSLLPKNHVAAWFARELRERKLFATVTLVLALAGSVLTEVVLPLSISRFLRDATSTHGEPQLPVVLIGSAVLTALIAPFRVAAVRRLEYLVRHGLGQRVRETLAQRTNVLSRQNVELDSAAKTFLDAWSRMGIATFTQCPTLVVGGAGMLAVMASRAPFMLVVAAIVAVSAVVAALTAGRNLLKAWGKRTKFEHQTQAALDDMVASHKSLWLLRITEKLHIEAAQRWLIAARAHSRRVLAWQFAINGLTYSLLVGAVVGGWLLGSMQVDTSFLLVWFSVMMMGHINNLFLVVEAFGSSLIEAQTFVVELGASERKPPPACLTVRRVDVRDVVVTYPPEGKDEPPTVVSLGNSTFGQGLTIVTGGNGNGKSTLLTAVVGMVQYQGEVTYETPEGPIEARDVDARRFSVFSTQSNASLGSLTVRSLFDGAGAHEIYEALGWSGFPDKISLERRLDRLSGGQRRMIYNAAALHAARELGVLILDEPTNDLSKMNIARFMDGLQEFLLDHSGVIAIVVTHDSALCTMADTVVTI